MGDSILNHLMMLHVHKDGTDALTLVDVAIMTRKAKEIVWQIFRQTISQTKSLFQQSHHKWKIRDKNKRYSRQM